MGRRMMQQVPVLADEMVASRETKPIISPNSPPTAITTFKNHGLLALATGEWTYVCHLIGPHLTSNHLLQLQRNHN